MSTAQTLSPEPLVAPAPRPIGFDGRRPWPLGLPTASEVLEALAARAEVDRPLQAPHRRVVSLLPEQLRDAVRSGQAGGEANPLALATASAWRTLVANTQLDAAMGVNHAALSALIDEAVDAREKLLAAGYFALDGGAGADRLVAALDGAIERLLTTARHHAPGKRPAPLRAPLAAPTGPRRHRALRRVLWASLLLLSLIGLADLLLG